MFYTTAQDCDYLHWDRTSSAEKRTFLYEVHVLQCTFTERLRYSQKENQHVTSFE